jgi:hypothetical protein
MSLLDKGFEMATIYKSGFDGFTIQTRFDPKRGFEHYVRLPGVGGKKPRVFVGSYADCQAMSAAWLEENF